MAPIQVYKAPPDLFLIFRAGRAPPFRDAAPADEEWEEARMAHGDMSSALAGRERDALAWHVASTLRTLRSEGTGTEQDHRAREHEAARQLEAVEVEATRLAAQVRQMAAANRALRTANRALVDTNTELRRGTAEAQADTADARADTVKAQADTANAQARYQELHATVEEVENANAELRPYRAEQRKLAAVLEAKRAQLAVVLAGIEDAALVVDDTGAPVRANAAYVRLFGDATTALAPEDAHGRPLAPDRTPRARAARGETFSMSFSLPTGVPNIAGEDTRRWFEANGRPFPESGKKHALLVIRDTTQSDQHLSLQDEFLVLASHELRTPLTVLQGYVELLQPLLGERGDARARRYAMRALHETRRLAALVRDLTDGARLQTGKLALDLAPVDLTALVTEVVDATREGMPDRAIRLALDVAPLWVRGDAGRLEQVLFNLLTNAITHAPSAHAIDVRLRREGDDGVLEVRDHGRGIAAAHLPYLFARFYQVARDDRPSRAGLGLGLFICEELVRAHGGHMTVASKEGAGTTFAVCLPLLQVDTAVSADEDAARDAVTATERGASEPK